MKGVERRVANGSGMVITCAADELVPAQDFVASNGVKTVFGVGGGNPRGGRAAAL